MSARLAGHLRKCRLRAAAALVERNLIEASQDVRDDVAWAGLSRDVRDVTVGLVALWERGAVGDIADALDAWERIGCERCAIAVVQGTDRDGRCPSCVEDGR